MITVYRTAQATVALALITAGSSSVNAVPIAAGSEISFIGQSTCSSSGCTFGSALASGGTGSFSSFTLGSPATFFPISFGAFASGQVYTSTNPVGQTASFFATAREDMSTNEVDGLTGYSVTESGTARLTGFDDTPGFLLFTANQRGTVQGSFSATSDTIAAAPEIDTWAMMLIGFGGIGGAMRRRRSIVQRAAAAC